MARGNKNWVKGHPKIGGRTKGTPNKRNAILEKAFASVVTPDIAEKLVALALREWAKGKGGLAAVLFPYCIQELPKAIIHQGAENMPVKFTLTFDNYKSNGVRPGLPTVNENGNGNGHHE